ncbi:hypothetical protein V6N13_129724 [Hibiscus sabdariffa]
MTFMESNSDIDFNDVFGGPPRRRSDETVVAHQNPWSSLTEKPVFREEETANRRRYSKNGFFDDNFRGNQSLTSSPRKYEMKDPFEPTSQLLSPCRPLPPKAEPVSSSFPSQFSGFQGQLVSLGIQWANKGGVPFAIPLQGSHRFKEKDKLQRCSSANGWIACESIAMEPKENSHNNFSSTNRMPSNDKNKHSFPIDRRNEVNEPFKGRKKDPDDGKGRDRGKVKELIKSFNQEASLKPRADIAPENHSSRLKQRHNVLWTDSGWKPVPLTDIIEGRAVRKSYQKALLYLHPDELQQKGAASYKKYIAEKVFDILQDKSLAATYHNVGPDFEFFISNKFGFSSDNTMPDSPPLAIAGCMDSVQLVGFDLIYYLIY